MSRALSISRDVCPGSFLYPGTALHQLTRILRFFSLLHTLLTVILPSSDIYRSTSLSIPSRIRSGLDNPVLYYHVAINTYAGEKHRTYIGGI